MTAGSATEGTVISLVHTCLVQGCSLVSLVWPLTTSPLANY